MQRFSKKETFLVANTLNSVPVILEGQAVLIDLINENSVAGIIHNSDGLMNINLVDVVYIDRNGLQYPFKEFMVRSRMIRQIHIPKEIDMEKELRNWTENGLKPKRAIRNKDGKRTYKQKRAEERHKEILQKIEQSKKN